MGILTLLRNAFGRSRKARSAESEGAVEAAAPVATPSEPEATKPTIPSPSPEPTPASTPSVPEPRTEHDLVSEAFDKVTTPDPAPQPEPTPAPAAKAEPKPEPEAAPEPTAKAEPAPEPKPKPETEPEPVIEAKAEAEATPEPAPVEEPAAAADGEDAPQGPPAPDDESRTGGAGGNESPAEGEAEADPEPDAAAADPEPATKAEPDAEPEAEPEPADGEDTPQGPPAPDDESRTGGAGGNESPAEGEAEPAGEPHPPIPPTLATAYNAAATTLTNHDLTGARAKIYLVLDRSASMRPYYKDGSAQALGEQTLALAAHLDPTATVHVTFFSTELDGTGELTLTDHENKIDELHAGLGRMGRTSYHAAVEAVLTRHAEEEAGTPALVIFQTDGAPDAKTPATQSLTDAAKNHPTVFFSFVAFGEHDNKAFDYLRKLKTENTAFFHAGPTPRELTDSELYEGVLASWRP
ncbi:VWA domain-containing protein [Streptomyces sp. NPDC048584]|uniref:VWA domain-containing protein n=1 Tax=Streptomyces sp. NPDC048584 TaxID=3365573 RepID=UPI00371C9749